MIKAYTDCTVDELKNLPGYTWAWLLIERPELAKHCDWSNLDANNWVGLLLKRPEFAEHCDWSKLTGDCWAWLLHWNPDFAKYCDWSKLNGDEWIILLLKRTEFAKHCTWNELSEENWEKVVQLRKRLGLNKNKDAQIVLATKHPKLFDKILPKNQDADAKQLRTLAEL